eukprot:CAMPEP_0116855132 /NCGR_PEP_ID=MMETSP0418-20121206/19071_1 /TAXON_ID=1158023 /ORGANISM="Astrosyne radiata, Strain 13vi08-1A" /LENGTH=886 /DNA_ID=CAMNT_0004488157 /DNA_START=19 /DNA_END=2679 /DNA_ORIENTATION=-
MRGLTHVRAWTWTLACGKICLACPPNAAARQRSWTTRFLSLEVPTGPSNFLPWKFSIPKQGHGLLVLICQPVGWAVCASASFRGGFFVVGGCNKKCLNTVEFYDPANQNWITLEPMRQPRQGCGVAIVDNKLIVVGGFDGEHILHTTEVLHLPDEILQIRIRKDRELIQAAILGHGPVEISLAYCKFITNDFKIRELLGNGHFDDVFRGNDPGLLYGVQFAVRKISIHSSDRTALESAKAIIQQEIHVLQYFKHPNIARLFATAPSTDGTRILVYEFGSHLSLEYILKNESHCLDWSRRLSILLDVCGGLDYLHTGGDRGLYEVLHGDLKSASVVITSGYKAKLIHFGFSTFIIDGSPPISTDSCSKFQNARGLSSTLGYRCPFYQSKHGIEYTQSSDIFSLGVVMAELISGYLSNQSHVATSSARPIGGNNGRTLYDFFMRPPEDEDEAGPADMMDHLDPCAGTIDEDIARDLVAVCKKSMKYNPKKRPHLSTIIDALRELQQREERSSVTEVFQNNDSQGTACTKCDKKSDVWFQYSGASLKHCVCSTCIHLLVSKPLENPDIRCPIDNCQGRFSDEDMSGALGPTGFKNYMYQYSQTFPKEWRDALAHDVREAVSGAVVDAPNSMDVVESLRRRVELLLLHSSRTSEHPNVVVELEALHNKVECLTILAVPYPRCFWMLPCKMDCSCSLAALLKSAFTRKWKIYFVCEKSNQIANTDTPMEIELNRQWMRKLAPLFRLSLLVLNFFVIAGMVPDVSLTGVVSGMLMICAFAGFPLPPTLGSMEGSTSGLGRSPPETIFDAEEELGLGAHQEKEETETFSSGDEESAEMRREGKDSRLLCLRGQRYQCFGEIALKPTNRLSWEPYMKRELTSNEVIWVAKAGCT